MEIEEVESFYRCQAIFSVYLHSFIFSLFDRPNERDPKIYSVPLTFEDHNFHISLNLNFDEKSLFMHLI